MLLEAGREAGLAVAAEAFADRRYLPDGIARAAPRPDALLTDPRGGGGAGRALGARRVRRRDRRDAAASVRADTICLHGDTPGAPAIARRVGERLRDCGVRVAPMEALPPGAHAAASLEARP